MSTNIPVPQEAPAQSTAVQGGMEEVTLRVPFPDTFVYSNIAAFSVSMMDIRIGFGEAMPDRTVQPKVGIVMPPEQAAMLAMLLLTQINTYERSFGLIREPRWREFSNQLDPILGQPQPSVATPETQEPPA
jgi:hypothetical protein